MEELTLGMAGSFETSLFLAAPVKPPDQSAFFERQLPQPCKHPFFDLLIVQGMRSFFGCFTAFFFV